MVTRRPVNSDVGLLLKISSKAIRKIAFICATIVSMVTIGVTTACHQKMRVIIPTASWEPIFFKSINSAATLSGQTNLRNTQLPKGDIEIRIWWGFGLSPLEGVTLRRVGGRWSAIHVKANDYYEPTKAERRQLSHPKSGWETAWTRLVNERLLSLPDTSETDCYKGGLDTTAMVVEINSDNTYRTYMYHMTPEPKCIGDKNIMAMIDILFEEFNLKSS